MVAALSAWHEDHERAAEAAGGIQRLPAHVIAEAYSVLTRLPAGLAAPPSAVAQLLAQRFPGPALTLDAARRAALPETLAAAGVIGGATYDALVGLEAAAGGAMLLTLDRRAQPTYAKVGASVRPL